MSVSARPSFPGSELPRAKRFQEAYTLVLPKLEALGDDLLIVNLDIPSMVTIVLGALSEIRKLRETCASDLPKIDLAVFEDVEMHALAMAYAHSRYQATSLPALTVKQLSSQVVAKRNLFVADCTALAARDLIDGRVLDELKGGTSYRNQAFDLLRLVALMRDSWHRIRDKSAVALSELDDAETLSDRLLTAVGERELLPAAKEAAADMRRRAYTLFVRSYDELRRIAIFLRWHEGDADAFVPSIYAGKKQRAAAAPVVEAAQPAPVDAQLPAISVGEVQHGPAVGMSSSDPFAEN